MAIDKVQLQSLDIENTPLGQNVPEDYVFFYDAITGVPYRVQIKDIQVTATGTVYTVNGETGNVVLDYSDVGALPSTYTPTWGEVIDKPDVSLNGHTHVPSDVIGTFSISQIPTGTTSTTVALGNHNHNTAYAPIVHNHLWSEITAGVPETATRWPTLTEVGLVQRDYPNFAYSLGTEDLNNITTPGFYYQSANVNTSTARHYPVALAGSLLVMRSADFSQIYTTYQPGGQTTWQRNNYKGVWSPWYTVYTTGNKPTYVDVGAPSTTGVNATGTWGVSITGNAATATTATKATTASTLTLSNGGTVTNTGASHSTINVSGYAKSGYYGVALNNDAQFMSNGSAMGLYWGSTTKWGVYSTKGGATFVNYNGDVKLTTANTGVVVTGTMVADAFSGPINGNATSATTATLASTVTINYNNNTNNTFQMLWGSGTGVYGTAGIYCNPSNNFIYSDSIMCSNWVRTTGNTGWHNGTYNGGFYMSDTTWIRTYNNRALYVGNQIAATGEITAAYSDGRLKDIHSKIEPEEALSDVCSWNKVRYTANEKAKEIGGYDTDKQEIGLITQDLEDKYPELTTLAPFDMETKEDGEIVSKSGENYKTIKYERTIPVLAAAIEGLKNENDSLKLEINELKLLVKKLLEK